MNRDPIKCSTCGKFVKYDDIISGAAHCHYEGPTSPWDDEKHTYTCRRCNNEPVQRDASTVRSVRV